MFITVLKKNYYGDEKIGKIDVKKGDRVELLAMDDTMTSLQKGSQGTVESVDTDEELIWVNWDNGERLALLDGIDKFKIIKK